MPSAKRCSRAWDSGTEELSSQDESYRRKPKRRAKERKRKEASMPWSEQEIELLMRLVQERQDPTGSDAAVNWGEVSALMGYRNPKQCREKFRNDLRPDISKGPWSPEEEYVLALAHSQLGNKWSDIARHLPRRAENTIKNHWYATLRSKADHAKTFLWVYATYATTEPAADCLQAAKEAWAELVDASNGALCDLSTFEVQDDYFTDGPGAQHAALLQQAELQAAEQGPGKGPLRSASARAAVLAGSAKSAHTKKDKPPHATAGARLSQSSKQHSEGMLAVLPSSWMRPRADHPPVTSNSLDAPAADQAVITGTVTVYQAAPVEWAQAAQPPSCGTEVLDVSQQAARGKGVIISTAMAAPHSIPLRPSEGGDASCTVAFQISSLQPVDDKHTKAQGTTSSAVGGYDVIKEEAPDSLQCVGYQLHMPLQPSEEHWPQNMSARAGTVTITSAGDCIGTEQSPNINLPSPEVVMLAQPTSDDQWLTRGTALASAGASPTAYHTERAGPTFSLGAHSKMDGNPAACMTSPASLAVPQRHGTAAATYPGSSRGLVVHVSPEHGSQQQQFSVFLSPCDASDAAAAGQYASLPTAASRQVPAAAAPVPGESAVIATNGNQAAATSGHSWLKAPRAWTGGLVPNPNWCASSHPVDGARHPTPASSSCPAPVQDQWQAASLPHSRSGVRSYTVHHGMGPAGLAVQAGHSTGHQPEPGHVWSVGCHRSSVGSQMQQHAHYPSMYDASMQMQRQSVYMQRRQHQSSTRTTVPSHYHMHPYVLPPSVQYMHGQLPQQSLPTYAGHLVYQQPPRLPPGQPYLLAPQPYQQPYHVAARAHQHVKQAGAPNKPRHVPMSSFTMHGGET